MDLETEKIFQEVLQGNNNDSCADCKNDTVTHVNCYFKITLCEHCAIIHMTLPAPLNHIKSIGSNFESEWYGFSDISFFRSINNRVSNEAFQQAIPVYQMQVTANSPRELRKNFIFAKYKHNCFVNLTFECNKKELRDAKRGVLMKKDKKTKLYRERFFELNENKWIKYYQSKTPSNEPKCTIPIDKLDVYLVPDKMGIDNGVQLSFLCKNSVRDIYIYSESSMDVINWFHLIRWAKLELLKVNYPTTSEDELVKFISGRIVKEGWLNKSGPRTSNVLRKRWFALVEKPFFLYTQWVLRYYENPLADKPKGEIYIGKEADGFAIKEDETFSRQQSDQFTFSLVTLSRIYDLVTESSEDRTDWIRVIKSALKRE